MPIQQTLTTSFKKEVFQAVHDFDTDTFKLALYTGDASIGAETTVYNSLNEVVGTGYVAGGNTLTGVSVTTFNTTAYITFENSTWNPASFTSRAALIYNSSKGNKAVAILDFGSEKTAVTSFVVQMPANTATSALIRFV